MRMKVSYSEDQQFIESSMIGLLDMDAIERGLVEMNTAFDRYQCSRILYDLSEVEVGLETHEIYFVPKLLIEAGNQKMKRAVIFSNDNEQDFNFFETVAANQGLNVQIFRDLEAVLHWLLA